MGKRPGVRTINGVRILPLVVACVLLAGCNWEDDAVDTRESQIAVVCAGGSGICVIGVDGEDETQLVENIPNDSPTWSSDGKWIAFAKLGVRNSETASFLVGDDIYAVSADGSQLRTLTEGPDLDSHPAWSPDGKRIAFASDRELRRTEGDTPSSGSLYTMDVDGSGIRRLTHGTDDSGPAWSRDGERIAFSRGGEIWVIDADGSRAAVLRTGPVLVSDPSWSPDGASIVVDSVDGLYLLAADGTGAHRLVRGVQDAAEPAWSPDGKWIAFSASDEVKACSAIFVVRPDGTGLRKVGECSSSGYRSPAWRPEL